MVPMFAKEIREDAAMSAKRFVLVVLERLDDLYATDQEIRDAGGPSTTTMGKYRKVRDEDTELKEPRNDVFQGIDAAAKWQKGSARALWRRDAEPVTLEAAESAAVAELREEVDQLRQQVARLMGETG